MCRQYISTAILVVLMLVFLPPLPSRASPEGLLLAGTGAYHDGFYQVAEAQFRSFLQSNPAHPRAPDASYLLGKALYEQGRFAEAKGIFQQLLTSIKGMAGDDSIYFWLSRTCAQLGENVDAEGHLLTIITRFPQSPWYQTSLVLLGKSSFLQGEYKKAEMYLTKSLHDQRDNPITYSAKFWLGLTLYEEQRYKDAEELFRIIIEEKIPFELLEEALYWLGETLIKRHKYNQGATTFRIFLDRFPRSTYAPYALYAEGLCLFLAEKKQEALRSLLIIRNRYPHASILSPLLLLIGYVQIDLGMYKDAIETLKEHLNRFPHDVRKTRSLLGLAWCYLKLGNLSRVREIAYEIMKLSPLPDREKWLGQYILAVLNTSDNNCPEAVPYWFNLLNAPAYREEALYKIALCSFLEGKYKECLVNLDLIQLEYPNFSKMDECLWIQGESFMAMRNTSEARSAYLKVADDHRRSPWQPWCIYRLIIASLAEGDLQSAERHLEKLCKRHRRDRLCQDAALKVGIKKAQDGDYDSSAKYLQLAIESADTTIWKIASCWQGEIYFSLNEYAKSRAFYQKAIGELTHAGDEIAAMAYAELGNINFLLGDDVAAQESYKKAVDISRDDQFKSKLKSLQKELRGRSFP